MCSRLTSPRPRLGRAHYVPPEAHAPLRLQKVHRTFCKTASGPRSGAALNFCLTRQPLRPGLRPFGPETFPRKVSKTGLTPTLSQNPQTSKSHQRCTTCAQMSYANHTAIFHTSRFLQHSADPEPHPAPQTATAQISTAQGQKAKGMSIRATAFGCHR